MPRATGDEPTARIQLAGLHADLSATLDEIVGESTRTIVRRIYDEWARRITLAHTRPMDGRRAGDTEAGRAEE